VQSLKEKKRMFRLFSLFSSKKYFASIDLLSKEYLETLKNGTFQEPPENEIIMRQIVNSLNKMEMYSDSLELKTFFPNYKRPLSADETYNADNYDLLNFVWKLKVSEREGKNYLPLQVTLQDDKRTTVPVSKVSFSIANIDFKVNIDNYCFTGYILNGNFMITLNPKLLLYLWFKLCTNIDELLTNEEQDSLNFRRQLRGGGGVGSKKKRNSSSPSKSGRGKLKLVSVKRATDGKHKFTASFENASGKKKVTHFGALGMDDYTLKHDVSQRQRYRARHHKDLETRDVTKAGYLSYYILWGESTSLQKNIASYKSRFRV
jgi:hypothetical protein